MQKSRNRAAGARFYLEDAKRRRERAEGGPMEGHRRKFDEIGAHDRPIAPREPGGAGNDKSSASRSILVGPAGNRHPTVDVACGRRESGYLKGWGPWSPRYTKGGGLLITVN